ncbi:alpha/beta hydrolase fold domain-containing protein [Micromonospora sp. NPDC005206]|uniref:alpha/beta hydrolase fold domain-containing protein n=1 Tax=Micromonospora sp. NPDC005206 TaxID=3157022 RepID=UPI0033B9707A
MPLSKPATRAGPLSTYGVPALATDLAGLPDALVVTAENDPSRDALKDYGHRIRAAGVQTALLRYPGVAHGFMSQTGTIRRSNLACAEIGGLLRAKFATPRPVTTQQVTAQHGAT